MARSSAAAVDKPPHREDKTINYVIRVLDIPWWYYTAAAILALAAGRNWRWEGGLLAGYAFFLIALTLLVRKTYTGAHIRLEPLWSWRAWQVQKMQILGNVVVFIPFGVLAGRLWKWKGLAVAARFSLAIELTQLVSARGFCEFDDVLHNCIGALIGVGIVMMTGKKMR